MTTLFAAKQLKPAPRANQFPAKQHDKSSSTVTSLSKMAAQHNAFPSEYTQDQSLDFVAVLSNN